MVPATVFAHTSTASMAASDEQCSRTILFDSELKWKFNSVILCCQSTLSLGNLDEASTKLE